MWPFTRPRKRTGENRNSAEVAYYKLLPRPSSHVTREVDASPPFPGAGRVGRRGEPHATRPSPAAGRVVRRGREGMAGHRGGLRLSSSGGTRPQHEDTNGVCFHQNTPKHRTSDASRAFGSLTTIFTFASEVRRGLGRAGGSDAVVATSVVRRRRLSQGPLALKLVVWSLVTSPDRSLSPRTQERRPELLPPSCPRASCPGGLCGSCQTRHLDVNPNQATG